MDAIEEEKYDSEYGTDQAVSSKQSSKNQNFQVVIRVRPPLQREVSHDAPFRSIVHIDQRSQQVSCMEYMGAEVVESER